MTHPFFAAVQAAYDAHGLPPDVASLHVHGPNKWRDKPHFGVIMTYVTLCSGSGETLADAYAKGQGNLAHMEAMRRDDEAKAAARKLLADAGLSPDLVRE